MYEELISRLRTYTNDGTDDLRNDAADAIEELIHEYESLAKTVNETAEWLHNRNTARWIPVTERLPEPYTWVLVSAEKHKVAFDAFYDGVQWKDAVLNGLIVTHWQPLPEPPKEETE